MAKELTLRIGVIYSKGKEYLPYPNSGGFMTKLVDVAGSGAQVQEVATSTTPANLDLAPSTQGYVVLENLDATNSIRVRAKVGEEDLVDLTPGRPVAILPLKASLTPQVVASAGTPKLRYIVFPA